MSLFVKSIALRTDQATGIVTLVAIQAFQPLAREPERPPHGVSSTLVIVGSHLPGDRQVLFAHELIGPSRASLEAPEPERLTAVSLSAKLALTDVFTGRAISLVVQLTYSRLEGTVEETDTLHIQGPDVSIDSTFHGMFQSANVTGRLLLDGEPFKPDGWLSRKVGWIDSSDLTIARRPAQVSNRSGRDMRSSLASSKPGGSTSHGARFG